MDRPPEALPEEAEVTDVTAAYRLWDDLFSTGIRLALSAAGDDPEEKRAARERLARGLRRSLRERDSMLERMFPRRGAGDHGR